MADQIILELRNVSKSIKKQTVVYPLHLQLDAGQVLALCGGNGAGKSTILRMIVGITQPTNGTIHVCGLEWKRDRKAFAEQIGYMPDDFQFAGKLTAKETITFYASLRHIPPKRAAEVLELVGLNEVRDKSVSTFSKGMRQRLLFAQAILANPKLLVLDEPTNGLDPYWMQEFVDLIGLVKRSGQTVIFSTHQLQIAESVADRAVFLNIGKVLGDAAVEHYRDKFGASGLHGAFTELISESIRKSNLKE